MLKRILVVDDDPDVRSILCDRLGAMGFEVALANTGRAGMEIIKATRIDGILLDVEMPVMNGLTMLRELRDRHPDIPVIMMSAATGREKLEEAMRNGAADYVLKPVDGENLEQKCKRSFG
jgi:DNA-binding response OmpR family regulator